MSELIPADLSIPPAFDYSAFSLPENVSLTFHLNPHKTGEDLPQPTEFDALLKDTDIIIPEFVHSKETKDSMAKIAMGRRKDYDDFRDRLKSNDMGGWMRAMISALYASRKATANIDVDISHPSFKAFQATEDALWRGTNTEIRSHFDEVLANVIANYASVQARDQAILENLTPEIEAAIAKNRNLAAKRENDPLNVRIFYGTMHRSLLDAVIAKHQAEPVEGFSAQDSADSIKNDLAPMAYAKFLRGQGMAVEDIERWYAYSAFGTVVHNRRYMGNDPSGRALTTKFLELESQLDTTDFEKLRRQTVELFESKAA